MHILLQNKNLITKPRAEAMLKEIRAVVSSASLDDKDTKGAAPADPAAEQRRKDVEKALDLYKGLEDFYKETW